MSVCMFPPFPRCVRFFGGSRLITGHGWIVLTPNLQPFFAGVCYIDFSFFVYLKDRETGTYFPPEFLRQFIPKIAKS
jgi:hypothetical protein